jgi:DNA repair protein RadD
MLNLRPYQLELIDRLRATIAAGTRRVLLTLPTGAGKTCLMAHMLSSAAQKQKRAWFCVHRRELVDQSVQTFIEAAAIDTGIVAAGYYATPRAPVQVCSVASLRPRAPTLQAPDLIVFDEAHHIASNSWSAVAALFPRAVHIGLTATAQRLDGRGLRAHFDELICGPSTADLIAQGYLSPYTLYAPPGAVNLSKVHRVAGDYDKQEVADAMDATTVVGDAVSHYRQHCPDARALVFAWSLDASRRIAQQFLAAGIPAQHVDGETPRVERTQAMRDFRAGTTRVLCNVDLFGEGLDVPAVDAVFLLRPTQSLGLYLQQVGRGLRPTKGKASVKIFDHVANWSRHGLPDDPREWTLDGREKGSRASSEAMGRRCDECFAVSPIGCKACRYCGKVFPVQDREIEEVEGTLHETDIEAIRRERAKWKAQIQYCATEKDFRRVGEALGYHRGWAWHMMFEKMERERAQQQENSEVA